MSKLKIGMVVEGPTDAIVLQAGLTAFIKTPFTAITLQPQVSPGSSGTGWSGVYRWCRQVASLKSGTLSENPILLNLDLVIIQIDADVAGMSYADAGIHEPAFNDLPCERPCPPASDTVGLLFRVVQGWLLPTRPGDYGIICVPSKCIEAWVAAGLYSQTAPELMDELECSYTIIDYFQQKPARERLIRSKKGKPKKIRSRYLEVSETLSKEWENITQYCPQAGLFQEAVEDSMARMNE
jgi:hypothetical protein